MLELKNATGVSRECPHTQQASSIVPGGLAIGWRDCNLLGIDDKVAV